MGEAIRTLIWPEHSQGHPNKSPLKILEKRERGHIQGLPNFWDTLYYLRNR